MRRRVLLGTPLALAAVLVAEVWIATRAEYLTDVAYRIDATVPPPGDGGDAPPLRLAVLGDSTVAGVGSPTADGALPVLLAERVAARLGRAVRVTGYGRSGARTEDVRVDQIPRVGEDVDVVVVVIGSNDVTHVTPPRELRHRTAALLGAVREQTNAPVVLGGIPEFATTPALAPPLRWVAGAYADVLRGQQRRAAATTEGVAFVDIARLASPRFLDVPESMAVDGYHPSPIGYGFWADALAPAVAKVCRLRSGASRIGP